MGLLEDVRAGCRAVAERAEHVDIDTLRLPAYAASLPLGQARAPALDPAYHYLGAGEDTVAFVLTLDAVNFGSGWFPHLRKRPGLSGYFTVAGGLTEHFRTHGPIPPERLTGLTAEDCAALFGQDLAEGPVQELLTLFARALNDLGHFLLERFAGRFTALVDAAGHSAERLVASLVEMPLYRDVARYEDLEVPFYKRAQITVTDLAQAFGGEGWGRFDDLERLTAFADNLVPHVLRVDGVLHYAPELAARLDRGEPLPAGSAEEIELRACAVHAVELLVDELRRGGEAVTAMGLDHVLWYRGQEPRYRQGPRRHRTRTVFY
jgi:Potential Queuosine, Q, salvage protein family